MAKRGATRQREAQRFGKERRNDLAKRGATTTRTAGWLLGRLENNSGVPTQGTGGSTRGRGGHRGRFASDKHVRGGRGRGRPQWMARWPPWPPGRLAAPWAAMVDLVIKPAINPYFFRCVDREISCCNHILCYICVLSCC